MNGERAKKRRKELGLSAESVAQALNTTRVTISRWEAGISEPDDKKKAKLAEILNTSVAYLKGDIDTPERNSFIFSENKLIKSKKTENKGTKLSFAYWGSVADNAHDVAESGDEIAISYVSHILRYALSLLPDMSNIKDNTNSGHSPITNMPLIIGDHNKSNFTVEPA